MALDPRLILNGVQAGIQNARPFSNLMAGAEQQQQFAGEEQRQNLLAQQAQQQAELAPLQQRKLEMESGRAAMQGIFGLASQANALPESARANFIRQNVSQFDIPNVHDLSDEIDGMDDAGILAAIPQVLSEAERFGFKQQKADVTPKQKADGGLVFDPTTGSYSIDPIAKQRYDEMAAQKAGAPLDFKDKQGLNKDVTGIIKGTVGVKRAAEELTKLQGVGSAAAKLGAVFKFMKALDPTSVVRESEQGQVYSAEGAGAQVAGMINSLLGQGKLTESGFSDLVNTSKAIANSNIESVGVEVSALLDSFGTSIPSNFKAGIMGRVPVAFDGVKLNTIPLEELTDEELAAKIAQLRAAKGG